MQPVGINPPDPLRKTEKGLFSLHLFITSSGYPKTMYRNPYRSLYVAYKPAKLTNALIAVVMDSSYIGARLEQRSTTSKPT